MIGLLGASGAVGGHAARLLARYGHTGLRLGGRRLDAVQQLARELAPAAEVMPVDAADDASLTEFSRGCTVVANCAGPSRHLAERAALATWAAGADYVDAGGDASTAGRVARGGTAWANRRAVFAAGAWPGLSGLFPRWLAVREFTTVHALRAYIGVCDRFTSTAAADYLDGALGGASEPLAAWRQGRRCPRALTRLINENLPFFSDDVTALPYLDDEGEQIARDLGLTYGDWFSIFPGQWLGAALDRSRTRPRAEAVADLCRASELDADGRPGSVTLLIQLDGQSGDQGRTRTGVLHGSGVSSLTGAITAFGALSVLRGEVPPGAHCAAAALDPLAAVAWLRQAEMCELTVIEAFIETLRTLEDGVL
jgi:hypothetical protein